jgi:uroporphyrinogen-III synthase
MANSGIAGTEILCLLSDLAAPVVPEGLRAAGASVAVKTAYRNQPVETIDPAIQATIAQGAVSAITFASPSAVESFVHLAGRFVPAMSGAAFVAIGETTANRMRTVGLPVHAIAGTPDPDGMVTAVCRSLGMMPKDQS